MSIAILVGSPSVSSRTVRLSEYVATWLRARGLEADVIDIRSLPANALLAADVANEDIARALGTVARARGVVVATPVYKAAYSGILKCFLDLLPQAGLRDKVVLPLATGGTLAHVLVIDYALRPVLASLGSPIVTEGLFLLDKQLITTEGRFEIEPETLARLQVISEGFVGTLAGR